ncbi:hypothetical protein GCM10027280_32840 [Micromonospora polyrhachis]|uniref:Uncharacterized protein n=1 Tax=Micromonospora polyrhachis TaxID=1282883 RepID=A0A7W7STU7_9ACTN|nr:hypothetical protein [Micromonospora polyrhachis]MBB4960877.1 hypothetical protein [Micromonospora polyrhachis]
MPMLGQLSALIGGGVLFIGDNESQADEDLGEAGPHPVLDVGPSQVIVRVQNGAADGATTVRVASIVIDDPVGPIVFDGTLRISSGVLRVGDGLDLAVLRFQVPIGDLPVRVYVDADQPDFYSPEFVDIVLPKIGHLVVREMV